MVDSRRGIISKLEPGPGDLVKVTVQVQYNAFEGRTYDDGSPMHSTASDDMHLFMPRQELAGLYPGDTVSVIIVFQREG